MDTLTSTAGQDHGPDSNGPVRGSGISATVPFADDADTAPPSRRLVILALGAVLVLAAGWYALHRLMTPPPVDTADANAQTVTVIVPGRTTVQASVTTSGVLAARRDLPVGVAGEGGRVVSVLVDAGAMVKKGQVLAVIDSADLAQAIKAGLRDRLVASTEIELVPPGTLPRTDYKSKLVDWSSAHSEDTAG